MHMDYACFIYPEFDNQEFYALRTLSLLVGVLSFQLQHNIAGHETGFLAREV